MASLHTDEGECYVLFLVALGAIVAGLVVANNFDVAKKPLMEKGFAENRHFFRAVFEIGRRCKAARLGPHGGIASECGYVTPP